MTTTSVTMLGMVLGKNEAKIDSDAKGQLERRPDDCDTKQL